MVGENQFGVMFEHLTSEIRAVAEVCGAFGEKLDEQVVRFDRLESRFDRMEVRMDVLQADVSVLKADVSVLKADVADMKPRMIRVESRLGLDGVPFRASNKRASKKPSKRSR